MATKDDGSIETKAGLARAQADARRKMTYAGFACFGQFLLRDASLLPLRIVIAVAALGYGIAAVRSYRRTRAALGADANNDAVEESVGWLRAGAFGYGVIFVVLGVVMALMAVLSK